MTFIVARRCKCSSQAFVEAFTAHLRLNAQYPAAVS
jgi:hypothetical protein